MCPFESEVLDGEYALFNKTSETWSYESCRYGEQTCCPQGGYRCNRLSTKTSQNLQCAFGGAYLSKYRIGYLALNTVASSYDHQPEDGAEEAKAGVAGTRQDPVREAVEVIENTHNPVRGYLG